MDSMLAFMSGNNGSQLSKDNWSDTAKQIAVLFVSTQIFFCHEANKLNWKMDPINILKVHWKSSIFNIYSLLTTMLHFFSENVKKSIIFCLYNLSTIFIPLTKSIWAFKKMQWSEVIVYLKYFYSLLLTLFTLQK